jgi:hypothetical protein
MKADELKHLHQFASWAPAVGLVLMVIGLVLAPWWTRFLVVGFSVWWAGRQAAGKYISLHDLYFKYFGSRSK